MVAGEDERVPPRLPFPSLAVETVAPPLPPSPVPRAVVVLIYLPGKGTRGERGLSHDDSLGMHGSGNMGEEEEKVGERETGESGDRPPIVSTLLPNFSQTTFPVKDEQMRHP